MPLQLENIRNIAVVAHGGAGKTSLVEAMLFDSGAVNRLGSCTDGTATTDFEPEEISRQMTISSSLAYCEWNGHRLNIVDTPGSLNFVEDAKGCMAAVDGAVFIVSAISGVKGETEKLWKYADEFGLPKVVFISKMDRDSADFEAALESIGKAFGLETISLGVPIGTGEGLRGVVDVLGMKAYLLEGGNPVQGEIPADMSEAVAEHRKTLVERVAESDDVLLEKYLEEGELSDEEVAKGLRRGSIERKFIPVLCGSATANIGVHRLLDAIVGCLASPLDMHGIMPMKGANPKDGSEVLRQPDPKEPFSAYVFKSIADPFAGKLSMFKVFSGTLKADSNVFNSTTDTKERVGQIFYMMGKKHVPVQSVGPGEIAVISKLKNTSTGDTLSDEDSPVVFEKVTFADPLISYAIAPKSKGDEDKVSIGLQRILEEDQTLRFARDKETKEMLLSGMGQVHLEVTLEKLKRKFGVDVLMKAPKIPYRETIKGSVKVQGKYKKQSGGRGQYGDCWIELKPRKRGEGFMFENKIAGGSIPRQYIPAVEKGIVEAMAEGIVAGYPMVDMKVTLYDGSYHNVDSSEMAFKIAGSMAIKKAVPEAKPILLEPVMKLAVVAPEEFLGAVIGDLNSKRGKVQGMEQTGGKQNVTAMVPMAEILTYANQLHGLTSGKGVYSMEFSHYDEMPAHQMAKLIEEKVKQSEEK